ncbi:Rne/Rng family ribonuclease [Pyrinomonas sp.]|uniref:Rne/Rng family ribonuclease n=1 Tax=Pyrinomonas sp. TaxID=2080306 RepID=UPI003330E0FD
MIISVNGREKKIAIIENGQVTEFYIERGETNQGVAGNIYKGRVMRVLPGMQSAFVDIGLERDAFLYVSDFSDLFDESEEFDRISIPKKVERTRAAERHAERKEARTTPSEEAPLTPVEAGPTFELTDESEGTVSTFELADEEEPAFEKTEELRPIEAENLTTPFAAGAGFERVVDEEGAADEGALLKDAIVQERITDEVRALEFDIEPTTTAEVGSILSSVAVSSAFERVDDSDAPTTADPPVAVASEVEEAPTSRRRSRRKKSEAAEVAQEEAPASRRGRRKSQKAEAPAPSSRRGRRRTETKRTEATDEGLEDSEARVSSSTSRAEFARRRRRRRTKQQAEPATDISNGNGIETSASETAPAAVIAPRTDGAGRYQQPSITELLREGQEVIVQIAKEPIGQKGARITSHIALPGRYLVYMPTIEHIGVSRKIESANERARLRKLIQAIMQEEDVPSGGFIVRTAGTGVSEAALREDARYLVRTWQEIRRTAERVKAPALIHRDLDLVQRILRDQLSDEFTAIRVDSEEEYLRVVEFVNRVQPRLVNRVKLYTREEPILEAYGVQQEIDKAIKPRVWLKSGGYLVINQTEALVAIDVNTGKFVGRGSNRLEDTITKTNLEAVEEIARQIRLRDLGGIIVLDLIDMEERRNRQRVLQALQEALQRDKSPTKVLSYNDFGLVIMTRKRVKQSLERTLCAPCPYCQGAGLVKSPQTVCYEILEEARRLARSMGDETIKQVTLRVNPEVARALRTTEQDVLAEVEEHLGPVDITSDESVHQEQFDFAFV